VTDSGKSNTLDSVKEIFMTQFNSHSLALGWLILSVLVVIYLFLPFPYVKKLKKEGVLTKYRTFSIGIFIVLFLINYILYPSYDL
jgi:uncharacterized membrane protein